MARSIDKKESVNFMQDRASVSVSRHSKSPAGTAIREKLRITILIPAHNEEKSIVACVHSCLNQSRPADEVLVINDGSTDRTAKLLAGFGDRIRVITIPTATGNKSHAQEYGLKFVTGDVFITTDGDTILHRDFVKYIEEDFQDASVTAVAGYVRSMKYNWLTACRAFEYAVGQNLHKLAQHYLNFLYVIPGAAGAFRTKDFFRHISFEHDTLTEDLDFTYRLHQKGLIVLYDRRVVVFTQDPVTIRSYVNQMRRWYGGGWQCLLKHRRLALHEPKIALELSLMYVEGILFSALLYILPLLSIRFFGTFLASYMVVACAFALFAAWRERRPELLLIPIPYLFLVILTSSLSSS
jgi:cellulose synthase/poly-beta-1,6-N-acetylglucosamine synthase-like glycosyltransferase